MYQIPDSPANQQAFPPRRSRRGISYPLLRWVCLVSLATAAVLDFNYGPYQGKQTGALALSGPLLAGLQAGDVLRADRYLCTWFTFALAQRQGLDVVARLHASRNQDFRVGRRYGHGERVQRIQAGILRHQRDAVGGSGYFSDNRYGYRAGYRDHGPGRA